MNNCVAVIGCHSFSGAAFTSLLLERGYTVIGFARLPEPPTCLLQYRWNNCDAFIFNEADINRDHDKIAEIIAHWEPRFVANFAAQGMVAQSWADPELWFKTNVVSMIRLHERLRQLPFLEKYLQVSTPEVYGATRGPITEAANYNPSTPYAASKAACDLSLLSFVAGYDFPVVFTRSTNVCGPGQQPYRIIPKTIISLKAGRRLRLEGGGSARRSFIHIRDVVEGQLAALEHGQKAEIFHLGTGEILSIRSLVSMICERMNKSFHDNVDFTPGRRAEDTVYELDCSKARRQLDWNPKRSLARVIDETLSWVDEHWDTLQHLPLEYNVRP